MPSRAFSNFLLATRHSSLARNSFIRNTCSRTPRRVSGFVLANPELATTVFQPKSSAHNPFRSNTYRNQLRNPFIRNTYKNPGEGHLQARQIPPLRQLPPLFRHLCTSRPKESPAESSCQPPTNGLVSSGSPASTRRSPVLYFLYFPHFPHLLYLLFHPTRHFLFTNRCLPLASRGI